MGAQWTTVHVDGQQMWSYLSLPDGPGPNPGVVVIQHGSGVDDWVQDITRRLSQAGYAAIAPDLFHRENPNVTDTPTRFGHLRDDDIIKDVNATIELLRRHPGVMGDRIGITGFCMGGRVSYLMAGANQALKVAAPFYPGNTMVSWGGDGPTPFDRIPNIDCPIIGFFGTDDSNPSPNDVENLDAAMKKHGKRHEFHSYTGAGHSFQWNGTQSYRAEAAADSWGKMLDWFQKYLRE